MVIDEAHRLKNPTSRLFEHLCSIPHQHCLLLTGTPLQNKTEVGMLCYLLFHFLPLFASTSSYFTSVFFLFFFRLLPRPLLSLQVIFLILSSFTLTVTSALSFFFHFPHHTTLLLSPHHTSTPTTQHTTSH